MTCICVDAMGGDCEPEVIFSGIVSALEKDSDLEVLVAGNEDVVVPFCNKYERAKPLITTQVIEMDEHPAQAIREKRDSSIVQGCMAVKRGDASAFFSAGSTGAIFSAATLKIGRIQGIKRPCLATYLPGLSGHETIFMDLGANADCRPEMLVQFAKMGRAFCSTMLGTKNPSVALLSNGEEKTKGNELTLAAHELLEKEDQLNFVGNCEGVDLLLGQVDVVVSDGFTGNCSLKTLEGTAKFIVARIKLAAKHSLRAALGAFLLTPAIKSVADDLSGDVHGGAYLLGVKAPVLIGHGSTSKLAVQNAILVAADAVRDDLVAKIEKESA